MKKENKKQVLFTNGIEQYEERLEKEGIVTKCNDEMEIVISDEDTNKLQSWNNTDVIVCLQAKYQHEKEWADNEESVRASNLDAYFDHLLTISNSLENMAITAGRNVYEINQLLTECYNLQDIDVKTREEWNEQGFDVIRGQYPYMFWSDDKICDEIVFKYASEQVH